MDPHLSELLGLGLADRWLEHMHLQLGKLPGWDLHGHLGLLAALLQA